MISISIILSDPAPKKWSLYPSGVLTTRTSVGSASNDDVSIAATNVNVLVTSKGVESVKCPIVSVEFPQVNIPFPSGVKSKPFNCGSDEVRDDDTPS